MQCSLSLVSKLLCGDTDRLHIALELCVGFRDVHRSVGLVLPHPEPQRVERRHDQERQDRRDQKPAHDGDRHRSPEDAPRQRDHAENRGKRGQRHRTRAANCGINDGAIASVPATRKPRSVSCLARTTLTSSRAGFSFVKSIRCTCTGRSSWVGAEAEHRNCGSIEGWLCTSIHTPFDYAYRSRWKRSDTDSEDLIQPILEPRSLGVCIGVRASSSVFLSAPLFFRLVLVLRRPFIAQRSRCENRRLPLVRRTSPASPMSVRREWLRSISPSAPNAKMSRP